MNIVPLAKMSADLVRCYSTDRNFSGNSVDPDRILHYAPSDLGSRNLCQGGGGSGQSDTPTFSKGGSNCLFPIETHITCDFPGGGGPDPLSPLWIRTWSAQFPRVPYRDAP